MRAIVLHHVHRVDVHAGDGVPPLLVIFEAARAHIGAEAGSQVIVPQVVVIALGPDGIEIPAHEPGRVGQAVAGGLGGQDRCHGGLQRGGEGGDRRVDGRQAREACARRCSHRDREGRRGEGQGWASRPGGGLAGDRARFQCQGKV